MSESLIDRSDVAVPIHAVAPDGLEGLLASLASVEAGWARATGFDAAMGAVTIIADASGARRARAVRPRRRRSAAARAADQRQAADDPAAWRLSVRHGPAGSVAGGAWLGARQLSLHPLQDQRGSRRHVSSFPRVSISRRRAARRGPSPWCAISSIHRQMILARPSWRGKSMRWANAMVRR